MRAAIGVLACLMLSAVAGCRAPMYVASDFKMSPEQLRGQPMSVRVPVHGRATVMQSGSNGYTVDLNGFSNCATAQIGDAWCWAAAVEMVTTYHGSRVMQVEVIRAAHGKVLNDASDAGSISDMLKSLNGWSQCKSVSGCPTTWLVHDLLFDAPVILSLKPLEPKASGHIVILTGVEWFGWVVPIINRMTIYDPADGGRHDFIGPEQVTALSKRMEFGVHFSRFEYQADYITQLSDNGPYGYQEKYIELLDRLDSARCGMQTHHNRQRLEAMDDRGTE